MPVIKKYYLFFFMILLMNMSMKMEGYLDYIAFHFWVRYVFWYMETKSIQHSRIISVINNNIYIVIKWAISGYNLFCWKIAMPVSLKSYLSLKVSFQPVNIGWGTHRPLIMNGPHSLFPLCGARYTTSTTSLVPLQHCWYPFIHLGLSEGDPFSLQKPTFSRTLLILIHDQPQSF